MHSKNYCFITGTNLCCRSVVLQKQTKKEIRFVITKGGVGLPWWFSGRESACQCRRLGFEPWSRKSPWRMKWQPTPVFLLGKAFGQRSLAGYSPWGCKRVGHNWVTEQQQQRWGRDAGGGTGWKGVRRYYKLPIVRYTSTRNIMNMKNIISTAVHSTWKLLLVSNEKEQKNTYYVFSLRCKNIENSYMMIEIRKSLPLVSETAKNWLEGCMREFSRVIKTLHILFCLVVTTVRTYQTEHLRFDHVIAYKVYCN